MSVFQTGQNGTKYSSHTSSSPLTIDTVANSGPAGKMPIQYVNVPVGATAGPVTVNAREYGAVVINVDGTIAASGVPAIQTSTPLKVTGTGTISRTGSNSVAISGTSTLNPTANSVAVTANVYTYSYPVTTVAGLSPVTAEPENFYSFTLSAGGSFTTVPSGLTVSADGLTVEGVPFREEDIIFTGTISNGAVTASVTDQGTRIVVTNNRIETVQALEFTSGSEAIEVASIPTGTSATYLFPNPTFNSTWSYAGEYTPLTFTGFSDTGSTDSSDLGGSTGVFATASGGPSGVDVDVDYGTASTNVFSNSTVTDGTILGSMEFRRQDATTYQVATAPAFIAGNVQNNTGGSSYASRDGTVTLVAGTYYNFSWTVSVTNSFSCTGPNDDGQYNCTYAANLTWPGSGNNSMGTPITSQVRFVKYVSSGDATGLTFSGWSNNNPTTNPSSSVWSSVSEYGTAVSGFSGGNSTSTHELKITGTVPTTTVIKVAHWFFKNDNGVRAGGPQQAPTNLGGSLPTFKYNFDVKTHTNAGPAQIGSVDSGLGTTGSAENLGTAVPTTYQRIATDAASTSITTSGFFSEYDHSLTLTPSSIARTYQNIEYGFGTGETTTSAGGFSGTVPLVHNVTNSTEIDIDWTVDGSVGQTTAAVIGLADLSGFRGSIT